MKRLPVNILLVDDHSLFRTSLSALIAALKIKAVVFEASNGQEALERIKTTKIDLILLDVQMPVLNGIEFLRRTQDFPGRPRIIVLSQFDEPSLIIHLLGLGANSFLLKKCHASEFEETIRMVLKEGHHYNAMALEAIRENIARSKNLPSLEMTARELQVLSNLKEGKTNKEIGHLLKLTTRTVESYRKTLMKKTKCRNIAEMVSLAYRTGIA